MNYDPGEFKVNFCLLARIMQSSALMYFVVGLFFLKFLCISFSVNLPQNIFFANIAKSALENFVNQERSANGLGELVENEQLSVAAKLKAQNMVENGYFSHTSPTGITPWSWFSMAGYNYKFAGENLAVGFYESKEVFNAWLNSPSHKANVLNPNYREIGTAVLPGFGSGNAIIVVQLFGSQKTAVPASTAVNAQTSLNFNNNEVNVEALPIKPGQQEVLSEAAKPSMAIEAVKNSNTGYYYQVMNAVLYNYDGILQNIVFGVSLIVIGILITLILANFSFPRRLAFRAFALILLLAIAAIVNRETVIALIPHQVII